MRRFFHCLPVLLAITALAVAGSAGTNPGGNRPRILCTTFPVYQITRQLTAGREQAETGLLLPSRLGCPHDYTVTPQDLQKLGQARILVINGLGLEEFLEGVLTKVNPGLTVVDSSAGIGGLIPESGAHRGDHHDHRAVRYNPHLFTSPRLAGQMAQSIARGLASADPGGAEIYDRNARQLAGRLNRLADEMKEASRTFKNRRIVTQHGAFDYLSRELGLEVAATVQSEDGHEPSAAELLDLIRIIRQQKVVAVFTEPQYSEQTAAVLVRETGIRLAVLDPGATGPENAPPDYLEKLMRKNLDTLKTVLGHD